MIKLNGTGGYALLNQFPLYRYNKERITAYSNNLVLEFVRKGNSFVTIKWWGNTPDFIIDARSSWVKF